MSARSVRVLFEAALFLVALATRLAHAAARNRTEEAGLSAIQKQDPQLHDAIVAEHERQCSQLELIASENYVSDAVLEATGSVLTNKYAEGLPGKRYYGGCEWVDVAESLARERLKQLAGDFGFDPKGRLFVGSITEPGWMAQPDRGAPHRHTLRVVPPRESTIAPFASTSLITPLTMLPFG